MSYYLGRPTRAPHHNALRRQFEAFIRGADYPCVGAKSALAKGQLEVVVARDLTSAWDDLRLHEELRRFVNRHKGRPRLFTSFAILFRQPRHLDEREFERHLWRRLQSLHDKDRWRGFRYDRHVVSDPDSPHFSFSVAGKAFFVIGLHPHASRPARRFYTPALVFNLHEQFEMLRREGKYSKLHDTIMARDRAVAGSDNPMLAPHGEVSAARQYSGRRVDPSWACPFKPAAQP